MHHPFHCDLFNKVAFCCKNFATQLVNKKTGRGHFFVSNLRGTFLVHVYEALGRVRRALKVITRRYPNRTAARVQIQHSFLSARGKHLNRFSLERLTCLFSE